MVREGYKQTEVGVIPENWDVVTIQDLTSLVTNGFVGKATIHYTDQDNGVTYIQGYNVEANSFNFNGIKKVTPAFHKIHQKSCLKKGDLLTVQTGEVGLTTIVPKELEGCNCHALIISRFKKDKAFPWFYAHYFNSSIGRLRLRDLEVGTTMKHINVADLLAWKVPYPPNSKEQRAIATALSDVDALITALDKLIAKKRHLKTATMQQLLTGKKRLPGFGEGKGYKQTEVGVIIPEDWEVVLLDLVAKRGSGHTPDKKRPEYWNGGIKWISLKDSDCLDDLYISDTADKTSLLGIANSSAVIHPAGTVVLSRDAGVGKSAIMGDDMAVSQHFMAWLCGPQLDNHFLYFWLQARKPEFERIAIGNTIKTIGLPYFKELKIPFPLLEEQRAIATVLSDMDAEIAALESRRTKTQALKQGMMQELLTGRTRLI